MSRVMISLHCGSMRQSAELLKEALEREEFSVWICVDMGGGDEFRDEIVQNIKSCQYFIPLINESWALSGECKDEFNLARRLNLTSHETKRTTRDQQRLPIILPVSFSDLSWTSHPHVELLAANTNFIVHNEPNLMGSRGRDTISKVLVSLTRRVGLKSSSSPRSSLLSTSTSSSSDDSSSSTSSSIDTLETLPLNPLKIEASILVEQLMNLIDQYSLPPPPPPPPAAPLLQVPPRSEEILAVSESLINGTKYFGASTLSGTMSGGYQYYSALSIELTLTNCSDLKNVECELVVSNLRNEVNGSTEVRRIPPLPLYLTSWLINIVSYKEYCKGQYDPKTGLLKIKGVRVQQLTFVEGAHGDYQLSSYSLVLFGDFCSGIKTRASEEVSVILRKI